MAEELKAFSTHQIEKAIADALTTLTGANYEVSISKIERIGTCLYDENSVQLKLKSNYSAVFAAARNERELEQTVPNQ